MDKEGKLRVLISLKGSIDHGRTLEVAKSGNLIIANIGNKEIGILNINKKNNEDFNFELIPSVRLLGEDRWIVDHKTCKGYPNMVCVITKQGEMGLFSFGNLGIGEGKLLAKTHIPFKEDRKEYCRTLSVCLTSTYYAIHLKGTSKASRIVVYKYINMTFRYLTEVDLLEEKISYFYAMSFFAYFQGCLILTAATCDSPSECLSFKLEFSEKKIEEVREFRTKVSRVRYPVQFAKVGDKMIGTDYFGKLMVVTYSG